MAAAFASSAGAVITTTQLLNFRSATPVPNTQLLLPFAIPGSTLLSVQITWRPSINGVLTVISHSGNTRTQQAGVTINSILASSAFNINTTLTTTPVQYTISRQGSTATVGLSASPAATMLSPAGLAAFIGNTVIPVVHTLQNVVVTTTKVSGGGGNHSVSTTINDNGELTVVYISTDVATIPEPQSWALLIAGFGLVGAALRRQRRAVARVSR